MFWFNKKFSQGFLLFLVSWKMNCRLFADVKEKRKKNNFAQCRRRSYSLNIGNFLLFFGNQFWSLLTLFSQLPFGTPMPGILLNYLISQYLHDTPLNQKKTSFLNISNFLFWFFFRDFFCFDFLAEKLLSRKECLNITQPTKRNNSFCELLCHLFCGKTG